jgi:hypothetical protein
MNYKVPPVKGSSVKERRRFWRKVIADQQASNMTGSGFCRQHNLQERDFRRWKSRLSKLAAKEVKSEVNFIPLNFVSDKITTSARTDNYEIDIRLANGNAICIKTLVTIEVIRSLIETLR